MIFDGGTAGTTRERRLMAINGNLVLIHGLMSSTRTWDEIVDKVVADEALDGLRIHRFGYPSPKIGRLQRLRFRRIPEYDDLAFELGPWLRTNAPDSDIMIVTHSQGGLILQRYLALMLGAGRGRELARVNLVVLLACPNNGTEFLESARAMLGYHTRPQTRELTALNERVADTLRTVMRQAVNADGVGESHCRIPFHVYAGSSDGIVPRASALSTFGRAESLNGDHFTILRPSSPGNFTFRVLRQHILEAFSGPVDRNVATVVDGGTSRLVTRRFVGRASEIAQITDSVAATSELRRLREFHVFAGMPGIGKTALATQIVRLVTAALAERDNAASPTPLVRHIDLHGFGPQSPAVPQLELRQLLMDEGFPATDLPVELAHLQRRWRSYLADKLLVLVLDNAIDEDQVEPFLPGDSAYLILVTSRRPLLGLAGAGAVTRRLKVLSTPEAEDLTAAIVGRPLDVSDHVARTRIAELCENHPFAITLAVAGLAARPDLSLANWLKRLTEGFPDTLSAIDDQFSGKDGPMEKMFGFSYHQLAAERRLVLRRIGLCPAPDISSTVAGIITGLDPRTAERHLRSLASEGLIEERGDRYRLHDLIRQYAAARAQEDDPDENSAAVERVLRYYLGGAALADTALTRQPPPSAVELLPASGEQAAADWSSAVAWTQGEVSNLLACADQVHASGDAPWVIRFSTALAGLLRSNGMWSRSVSLQTRALDAANRLGNVLAQANALHELGLLHRLSTDLPRAENYLERALLAYREVAGPASIRGRAHVLNSLAVVVDQRGRGDEAWPLFDESLSLCRSIGYRLGAANVANDRGMTHLFAGNHAMATDLLRAALEMYVESGQPLGQAHAHAGLARALRRTGDRAAAAGHLDAMRDLYRALHNRLGEASTWMQRGTLHGASDVEAARIAFVAAIEIYRSVNNQIGIGSAHVELAKLYRATGDLARAKEHRRTALGIFQQFGVARDAERARTELAGPDLDEPAD
jgi:tetratricopeptide (TPR) repeat protein